MRWLLKAGVQGVLSVIPAGERINYHLQTKVSRRLPRSDAEFAVHAHTAAAHLGALERARPGVRRPALHCYEFGAGWDLIGPISMWALGIDHQTLVDVARNVNLDLVNDTIERFAGDRDLIERSLGSGTRPLPRFVLSDLAELADRFGIAYLAPQDARALPLSDCSVDFVSSTFTLEHIPAHEITEILRETRRVMAPEAVFSSLIDLQDHYWYFDERVSPYNFLRYRPWQWRLLNPGLSWQSRLRHSQYLALFQDAGFAIASDQPERPSDEDLAELRRIGIAPEFRGLTPIDLGIRATHLVVVPAGRQAVE